MASSLPDMLTAKELQSLASYREATTDDVPAMGGKMLSSSSSSSTAKSAPENLWTSGRAFKDLSRPWKEVSRYSPTSGVNEKSKDLNRGGNQVAEDRCPSTSSMLKSPFVPPQSELRDEAQTDTGEMNPFIRWSQGGGNDPTIPELFPRPSPYNALDHALPPLLNTDKINSSNVFGSYTQPSTMDRSTHTPPFRGRPSIRLPRRLPQEEKMLASIESDDETGVDCRYRETVNRDQEGSCIRRPTWRPSKRRTPLSPTLARANDSGSLFRHSSTVLERKEEEASGSFERSQLEGNNIPSPYRFSSEATSGTLRNETPIRSPSPVSQWLSGPVPLVLWVPSPKGKARSTMATMNGSDSNIDVSNSTQLLKRPVPLVSYVPSPKVNNTRSSMHETESDSDEETESDSDEDMPESPGAQKSKTEKPKRKRGHQKCGTPAIIAGLRAARRDMLAMIEEMNAAESEISDEEVKETPRLKRKSSPSKKLTSYSGSSSNEVDDSLSPKLSRKIILSSDSEDSESDIEKDAKRQKISQILDMSEWSELDFAPDKEGDVIYDDDSGEMASQVCRNYPESMYSQSYDSTDSLELDGDGVLIILSFSLDPRDHNPVPNSPKPAGRFSQRFAEIENEAKIPSSYKRLRPTSYPPGSAVAAFHQAARSYARGPDVETQSQPNNGHISPSSSLKPNNSPSIAEFAALPQATKNSFYASQRSSFAQSSSFPENPSPLVPESQFQTAFNIAFADWMSSHGQNIVEAAVQKAVEKAMGEKMIEEKAVGEEKGEEVKKEKKYEETIEIEDSQEGGSVVFTPVGSDDDNEL